MLRCCRVALLERDNTATSQHGNIATSKHEKESKNNPSRCRARRPRINHRQRLKSVAKCRCGVV